MTVAELRVKLQGDIADADAELAGLRGAGKAEKTVTQWAVDNYLTLKAQLEVDLKRHADIKYEMDHGPKLPTQAHQARWENWRNLGIQTGKDQTRLGELERKVPSEAKSAVTAALTKREAAAKELQELKGK
jgi:hypothetical protein